MDFTLGAATNITRGLILLFLIFLPLSLTAHAGDLSPRKPQSQKPLDPMNRSMDELGVTGKDDTLCSDRWYSCTTYDRSSSTRNTPANRSRNSFATANLIGPISRATGESGGKSEIAMIRWIIWTGWTGTEGRVSFQTPSSDVSCRRILPDTAVAC